jgi:hypothetical protein
MTARPSVRGTLLGIAAVSVLASCSSSNKPATSPATSAGTGSNTTINPTGGAASAPAAHATESAPPGDIPDNQAFVAYSGTNPKFTVRVPEGWAMTKLANATVFTDKYNSIRIDAQSAATQPTVTSAQTSEVPAIKTSSTGFRMGDVKAISRTAGPVILITYQADSAPNAVTGKVVVESVERYEFWRNGTEVVLTLSSAVGSDNVDPWRKVTDSFAWTP